jgi:hypothetical protein
MPLDIERVVDRRMRLKETLRGALALEAPHLPLASSDAEMRVLCAIVVAQSPRSMAIEKAELRKCSTIRP